MDAATHRTRAAARRAARWGTLPRARRRAQGRPPMSKAAHRAWIAGGLLTLCGLGCQPALAGTAPQDLKAFAREFTEDVYNQQHRDRIPDYIHPDFVDHSPCAPPDARGPGFVATQYDATFGAFPDLKFELLDVLVDGDKVVLRWASHATFRGKLGAVAGHGQPVTVHGTSIFRVQDGKIIESWDVVDRLAMLRQAGFEVTPPKAADPAAKP
jgi:predicted ester cyclase